jgi:hypothetical protein
MFDQLLELKEKYNMMNVYLSVSRTKNGFDTEKLSQNQVNAIKEKIQKQKGIKLEKFEQAEFYHKNLIKTEKTFQNGTKQITYNMKSCSNYLQEQNDLIVMCRIETIEESQFPNLNSYDRVIRKTIEKYNFDNFSALLITEKGETILCIDILPTINSIDKIKLEKIILM